MFMIYLDNIVCGQLIENVQQQSYCVILFDEIEKGHPYEFGIFC